MHRELLTALRPYEQSVAVRRSFRDLGQNPFRNWRKFGAAKAFTGAARPEIAERNPVRA